MPPRQAHAAELGRVQQEALRGCGELVEVVGGDAVVSDRVTVLMSCAAA